MPKGRKFIPAIGDMIQMKESVAICTDLLTSSISDKLVYELLFLKDNSTQYASREQLTSVKRATAEGLRAYMMGNKAPAPVSKPTRVKKAKVTRRRRTKTAEAVEASA